MENRKSNIQYSARQLQIIAASHGVMGRDLNTSLLKPLRLAYLPYYCSKEFFELIQKAHLVWQKLVCLFANDKKEINRVFEPLAQKDDMVKQLLKLYNQTEEKGINKSHVNWVRTDFFEDAHTHQPKLVEYNLIAASAQGLSQHYFQARQLYQNFLLDENGSKLIDSQTVLQNNKPMDLYVNMVDKVLKKWGKKGIILMITHRYPQANIFDQTLHKIEYIKRGYKIIQVNFEEIFKKAKLGEDRTLFYDGQQVACVYYRTGYRPKDFESSTGRDQCYRAKRILELSDTLKLPSVKVELANLKRAQVELSKPQIYKKYLNEQECSILQKTLTKSFDFDNPSNFQQTLKHMDTIGREKFFLKPNRQGGFNNVSGCAAYDRLVTMTPEQRKHWILMEKIYPVIANNIFVGGVKHDAVVEEESVSQVGQFGYIIIQKDQIVQQSAHGYLIRTKPVNEDEGGIMTGVGSLGVIHTIPNKKNQQSI